jgi:metal-responsive CopG/Arc/MetJ family transcriptional regulator
MSRTQLTVTVPSELGQYVEELSAELGLKKSEVVSRALKEHRESHMELLLREGYEEFAEHDKELLKEFEHVDRETPWPEYVR